MNHQQLLTSPYYTQFVNVLRSPRTKETYTEFLNAFLNHTKLRIGQLVKMNPEKLQAIIIQYIVDLKKNGLSPNSLRVRLAAVKTFLQINDVELNWFKIKKYIGEFYLVAEDRPYTREEIKRMYDASHSVRDRAIILLLASSGMRRGALPKLQLKHLKKIDKYNIYTIDVYKKAKEHYYTFCTPEARKAIETYLDWRRKLGEKLTPESPLFRAEFDTRFGAQANIISMRGYAIRDAIKKLRIETGICENQPITSKIKRGTHRSEIMIAHGFRKFFDTTCTGNGMETLFVEIVMGHHLGLKRSYYKPKMHEVLEGNSKMRGYISIINDLTINEENRLKTKVTNLEQELVGGYSNIRKHIDNINKMLGLPPLPPTQRS